jgi:hypothetical protein
MTRVDDLPNDPALLKRIIAERDAQLIERDAQLIEQQAAHQQALDSAVADAVQQAVKAAIEATTAALLRRFYGRWMKRASPMKPARNWLRAASRTSTRTAAIHCRSICR